MRRTLVLQSHRSPLPWPWIARCLESVRNWSALRGYDYDFIGDELFDAVPGHLLEKTRHQPVIATDVARLLKLQEAMGDGYETVVWMDADFLVFNPAEFTLPDTSCALGREVWVQLDGQGRLRSYKKIHNAFLMFRQGDSFLDFYTDTAMRLLTLNQGAVPPQFLGPKLLTALHNVARLPVMESAGMLSPLVIEALLTGKGPALDLFVAQSPQPVAAANLCASSCGRGEVSGDAMAHLIAKLLDDQAVGPVTADSSFEKAVRSSAPAGGSSRRY